MATATVNGITVSYTDSGGDGPAVVLSHGYLMDSSMFDPQVAALAPEYRVITWDERGFGGTTATGPFSYWDSASDVIGLLDHLGIEQAVLGGMSQGGFLMVPDQCRTSSQPSFSARRTGRSTTSHGSPSGPRPTGTSSGWRSAA